MAGPASTSSRCACSTLHSRLKDAPRVGQNPHTGQGDKFGHVPQAEVGVCVPDHREQHDGGGQFQMVERCAGMLVAALAVGRTAIGPVVQRDTSGMFLSGGGRAMRAGPGSILLRQCDNYSSAARYLAVPPTLPCVLTHPFPAASTAMWPGPDPHRSHCPHPRVLHAWLMHRAWTRAVLSSTLVISMHDESLLGLVTGHHHR